jgi:hypothetical protein
MTRKKEVSSSWSSDCGASDLLTTGQKWIKISKRSVLLCLLKYCTMDKVQNPVILSTSYYLSCPVYPVPYFFPSHVTFCIFPHQPSYPAPLPPRHIPVFLTTPISSLPLFLLQFQSLLPILPLHFYLLLPFSLVIVMVNVNGSLVW